MTACSFLGNDTTRFEHLDLESFFPEGPQKFCPERIGCWSLAGPLKDFHRVVPMMLLRRHWVCLSVVSPKHLVQAVCLSSGLHQ